MMLRWQRMKLYSPEDFFTGDYLLMAKAIKKNDMVRLRKIAQRVNLDENLQELSQNVNLKGSNVLFFAVFQQNFEAISTLISLGVDPGKQSIEGLSTVLNALFTIKDTRFLQAVLDGGLSPNYQYWYSGSLIHKATDIDCLEHLKLLVKRGADINTLDSWPHTPLCEALIVNSFEVALYLVEQEGILLNAYDRYGESTGRILSLVIEELESPGVNLKVKKKYYPGLIKLRNRMIAQGIKWPPPHFKEVQAQAKLRGDTAVPLHGYEESVKRAIEQVGYIHTFFDVCKINYRLTAPREIKNGKTPVKYQPSFSSRDLEPAYWHRPICTLGDEKSFVTNEEGNWVKVYYGYNTGYVHESQIREETEEEKEKAKILF